MLLGDAIRCGDSAADCGSGWGTGVRDITIEVTILVLGEWQRLAQELPPDTPIIFRYDGEHPMENEDFCDGLTVAPSQMWEGRIGWVPCVLVTLGERF